MSLVPVFFVDAFADAPFRGNTAAVCLLERPADPFWMQQVADELKLPATAFVHPVDGDGPGQGGGSGSFGLRWFVAGSELTLCGHGTLAAAHVLWQIGRLGRGTVARFDTVSGVLAARRGAAGDGCGDGDRAGDGDGAGEGELIVLDFPAEPVEPVVSPPDLIEGLGLEPRAVYRGRLDYLVELASEREVRDLHPDFARLRLVETRGIIVTAPSATPGRDIVSRFFAPRVGLDEDAVTGSAHCSLGPFWTARLGRDTLLAYQASARGGSIRVQVTGSLVQLGGRAVTVLEGSLLAPPPPV